MDVLTYLHLSFNSECKTFICRALTNSNEIISNENNFLITVFANAKSNNEYNQIIPQAKKRLRIIPGYGKSIIQFWELNEESSKAEHEIEVPFSSFKPISEYIENYLNFQMADIIQNEDAVDNLGIIIELKSQIEKYKCKLNSISDIIND